MPDSTALEDAILTLLHNRDPGKTICPSEAARHVSPNEWRTLTTPARVAAIRLATAGRIEITRHGHIVDGATAKGPIRLRLPQT